MFNTKRINKYDNLKGIGILLIVLGHILSVNKSMSVEFVHDFTFIISLPIFFFVAGYFSKIGLDEPKKSFKRLIIPYIIFNIVYKFFCLGLGIKNNNILFIQPSFALWFLSALFIIKMLLPIYDSLKKPILITFIIALLIGFLNFNDYFGLNRCIAFTPVFLIGFYYNDLKTKLREKHKAILNILNNKRVMILIACLVVILCSIIALKIPFNIILLKTAYTGKFDIIKRIIVLLAGILSILILNYFTTNRYTVITKIGRNSLAVYILHVYFIKIIQLYYFKTHFITNGTLYLIFAFISTFIISFILSRDIITTYLNKMIDFVYNIFLT